MRHTYPGTMIIECMISLGISIFIVFLGHRCFFSLSKNSLLVIKQTQHVLDINRVGDMLYQDMHAHYVYDIKLPDIHTLRIIHASGVIIWKYRKHAMVRKSNHAFELIAQQIASAEFSQDAAYVSLCIKTNTYAETFSIHAALHKE